MTASPERRDPITRPVVRGLRGVIDSARATGEGLRGVVLVEGASDRNALLAVAGVLGRDLESDGMLVGAMGGITNAEHFLRALAAEDHIGPVPVTVLCDEGEVPYVDGVLARARADVELVVCRADLEDEVIRALGADRAEEVVAAEGDLRAFRSLQKQPEWRDRPAAEQLRRFLGSGSGRKIRYATRLVEALSPGEVPRPLIQALAVRHGRSSQ